MNSSESLPPIINHLFLKMSKFFWSFYLFKFVAKLRNHHKKIKKKMVIKKKSQHNKFKAILFKRNQVNKNFKNSQLGFNKEKGNKIFQKLWKIRMNMKKKNKILPHVSTKVAKLHPKKNQNHKPTKTPSKKIRSKPTRTLLHQTNWKLCYRNCRLWNPFATYPSKKKKTSFCGKITASNPSATTL